jgi:hypothetical protein
VILVVAGSSPVVRPKYSLKAPSRSFFYGI